MNKALQMVLVCNKQDYAMNSSIAPNLPSPDTDIRQISVADSISESESVSEPRQDRTPYGAIKFRVIIIIMIGIQRFRVDFVTW